MSDNTVEIKQLVHKHFPEVLDDSVPSELIVGPENSRGVRGMFIRVFIASDLGPIVDLINELEALDSVNSTACSIQPDGEESMCLRIEILLIP